MHDAHDIMRQRVRDAAENHRKQHHITPTVAADQIGITRSTYTRFEATTSGTIQLDVLMAILNWLGLELEIRPKPDAGTTEPPA